MPGSTMPKCVGAVGNLPPSPIGIVGIRRVMAGGVWHREIGAFVRIRVPCMGRCAQVVRTEWQLRSASYVFTRSSWLSGFPGKLVKSCICARRYVVDELGQAIWDWERTPWPPQRLQHVPALSDVSDFWVIKGNVALRGRREVEALARAQVLRRD